MKTLAIVSSVGQIVGFLLGAYGVTREGLAVLAELRAYGEGLYGKGPYGGVPTPGTRSLINLGKSWRLLPPDGKLDLTAHQRNARLAIVGGLVVLVSMVLGLIAQIGS